MLHISAYRVVCGSLYINKKQGYNVKSYRSNCTRLFIDHIKLNILKEIRIMYYAHLNENGELQTVDEHLKNVAELTSMYSSKFGAKQLGYLCGIMHDVGKYSNEFKDRLLKGAPRVDHSTAGALEIRKVLIDYFGESTGKVFGLLLGYIICGHHAGLMDYGSQESGLKLRFHKEVPKYYYDKSKMDLNVSKIPKEIPKNIIGDGSFTVAFFIRMLYSCLVDADFLDTERFMKIDSNIFRGGYEDFSSLMEKFSNFMGVLNRESKKNKINSYRQQIYSSCLNKAGQKPNLFTLTVPTGGGKTFSSMAFALNHLKYNDLKRIICVIPYTSIIEQNAEKYKDIFGKQNILENHSNFDFDKSADDNKEGYKTLEEKLKLASENWDMPIVVTTNVQFFESLFANKSSRCRKLHNITNSVVIIDEAQMIPTNFLTPSLRAIDELVNNYNTSVVLMTATKPEFPQDLLSIKPIEIMDNPEMLYEDFKRVEVEYIDQLSDKNLVLKAKDLNQVLIVVNTRNHAQKLYETFPKDKLYHLSAKMCSAHRSLILDEIRNKLKNREPCKVISTQLIECGVDISFPVVCRSLTGIDSIAQSAGRCNREGEIDKGKVYVFNSIEKHGRAIMYQSRTAECGRIILESFDDPLSLDAISEYFRLLYDVEKDRLDAKNIINNFEEGGRELIFNFEKAAKDYKLIEETENLIIPYNDEACQIIESLKYTEYPNALIRKLQPYTISIHQMQLKKLMKEGIITIIGERFYVLSCKEGYYDDNTGLVLGEKEILIL